MNTPSPGSLAALCVACPLRVRPLFRSLGRGDLGFVQRMVVARRSFAPETDILRADELGGGPYTLWDGWAYRYRAAPSPSGSAPGWQIVDILLPGDTFGLEVALTGRPGGSVRALTSAIVCAHDPRAFSAVFAARPGLARALLETAARDVARADARLAVLGQGSGAQRAAHLMLEMRDQLVRRGLILKVDTDEGPQHVPFPLRRRHLAAALGMSGTHVARSLAELEGAGLAQLRDDAVAILDPPRLAALCGYTPPPPDEMGRRALL